MQQWEKFINPIADTLVYCLMPNHFHVLIKTHEDEVLRKNFQGDKILGKFKTFQEFSTFRLSKQFGNLFSSYSQAYNKMYNRHGSLFCPNFKKKEITSDGYFSIIISYIHNNPVHHGFTKAIEKWPYSSYAIILSSEKTFINREKVVAWFGGKKELELFHHQKIEDLDIMETKFT